MGQFASRTDVVIRGGPKDQAPIIRVMTAASPSCTVAFDDDQWKAVIVFKTRKPLPPPPLHQMTRAIP
jgi:hypothetical protein